MSRLYPLAKLLGFLLLGAFSTTDHAAEPELVIQSRLQAANPVIVGSLLTLQLDVLTDSWFTAAPTLPDLTLAGMLVMPPDGHAEHINLKLGGKSFSGLRYSYRLTPTLAQNYAIPALTVRARPGQASKELSAQSEPVQFKATQPPGFQSGDTVLVAEQLRFTQKVIPSATPLKVGDSITRVLTLQADDALAMALPAPGLVDVAGLSRYPKIPQVSSLDDGRGHFNGGQRIDTVTYRIETEGQHTLPSITMKWWEASSGQARTIQVPAVNFEATANSAYKPVFSIADDLKQLGQYNRIRLSTHLVGWLAAIGVLIGAVYLGRPFFSRYRQAWKIRKQTHHAAWLQSPEYAWQQIEPQLAGTPLQLSALYLWLRRSQLGLKLATIEPGLQRQLRGIYGRKPSGDETLDELRQSLSTLQSRGKQQHSLPNLALRPLNPLTKRTSHE